MRLLPVLAIGLFLIATPASAQEPGARSYANSICSRHVPCPDDTSHAVLSDTDLAANASACVTEFSGYTSPEGFFDTMAGLDSNNCLTALPNVIPKGMGSQLTPLCCIIKVQENVCAFRCDLVTVR